MKRCILIIFLFFNSCILLAQVWPKIYGGDVNKGGTNVYEAYDLGYIIAGNYMYSTGAGYMGFIMKTDINGNILWEKNIGETGYRFPITANLTGDGGIIISGFTTKHDEWGDSYIIKLNACGEQEWCKIFHIPEHHHAAWDISELPDGTFISLINFYGNDYTNERIWLFCLSADGEVLWEKLYCQDPSTDYINETGYVLTLTSENKVLITGVCYLEYPNNSNLWYQNTLHIMIDSMGNELWNEPFLKSGSAIFPSNSNRTIEDNNGNFYTCGRRRDDPVYAHVVQALMKFDKDGNYIDWIRVYPDQPHVSGVISNVILYDTNHFVLTGGYYYPFDTSHAMLYKTDTLGNIQKEKELFRDDNSISHASLTSDNYVIMTTGHYVSGSPGLMKLYINKVDGELNEAEFDPRQLTYDSLCPYPILTDTIVPDCDLIVGHRPPIPATDNATEKLLIYPNPAFGNVTIKLPPKITQHGNNGFLSHTTVFHRWVVDASLQVFDINGKMIYSHKIPDDSETLDLDVSTWNNGIYLLKVSARNGISINGKLIVNH